MMPSGSAVQRNGLGYFGLLQKAVYGCLEINDPAEDATLQSLARQFGEEALDCVEPRR